MKRRSPIAPRRAGYTIVEVLIAAAILSLGAAAAAALAMTSTQQEEMNWRVALCLNWHENAATLYRLGHSRSEIEEILPPNPAIQSFTLSENNTSVAGRGNILVATSTLVFQPDPEITDTRTHVIQTVRLTRE